MLKKQGLRHQISSLSSTFTTEMSPSQSLTEEQEELLAHNLSRALSRHFLSPVTSSPFLPRMLSLRPEPVAIENPGRQCYGSHVSPRICHGRICMAPSSLPRQLLTNSGAK